MKYGATVEHARETSDNGVLREWVIGYRDDEQDGNNTQLANTLRQHPHAQVILKEYPLSKLRRMLAPEPSMPWQESEEKRRRRVDAIKLHASENITVPPLVATDFWDDLHLVDGSHRHQALLELGQERYWTIFCVDDPINASMIDSA